MKGSYFLSNPSHLTIGNIRLTEMINKGCFTMIDVPHNGDYWWFFDQWAIMADLTIQLFPIDDAQNSKLLLVDEGTFGCV